MPNSFSQLAQRRDQIPPADESHRPASPGLPEPSVLQEARLRRLPDPTGPYYVLQGYIQGQKFSERVPADQALQIEPLVANYKRFEKLAQEFVSVTDQLTRLSQAAPDAKKNSRRRSARSGSAKPTPSSD